mmetsp:Transcript_45190/g.80847  ORF Transcript_45190/g.80847 Transcript_45190/m.80847 type:complete len:101 (-) Transcript_45190:777-1079(-)
MLGSELCICFRQNLILTTSPAGWVALLPKKAKSDSHTLIRDTSVSLSETDAQAASSGSWLQSASEGNGLIATVILACRNTSEASGSDIVFLNEIFQHHQN